MQITVMGWYGHGNLGDEAMLEGIQHLFPSCSFTVLNDAAPVGDIIQQANNSDLFILGGGELIRRSHLFLPVLNWSNFITAPKIILGCGVNAESLEPYVSESLDSFSFIGLRDDQSREIVGLDRSQLCLDPSIILAKKYHAEVPRSSRNIAAIIPTERQHKRYDEGILSTTIIEDSREQLRQDLENERFDEIVLLAFGGDDNDDMTTCMRFARYLHKHGFRTQVDKPPAPLEALKVLSECRKAYTYRLHGLIFSYMLGVPFKCFGYHHKIKRVYDTLQRFTLEQAIENLEDNTRWISQIIERD